MSHSGFTYMIEGKDGITYEYIPDEITLAEALANILLANISTTTCQKQSAINVLIDVIVDKGLQQDKQFCNYFEKELEGALKSAAEKYIEEVQPDDE